MNDSFTAFKLTIAAAVGTMLAYFNVLLVPVIVLTLVMMIDYFTGMWSAKHSGELSSRVGVTGILKKVGCLALVAVGMVVDYLITTALVNVGMEIQINYCFAMMIIIWLIINELISILENLGEIGVPIPHFLVRNIKKLKDSVESRTGETPEEPH